MARHNFDLGVDAARGEDTSQRANPRVRQLVNELPDRVLLDEIRGKKGGPEWQRECWASARRRGLKVPT